MAVHWALPSANAENGLYLLNPVMQPGGNLCCRVLCMAEASIVNWHVPNHKIKPHFRIFLRYFRQLFFCTSFFALSVSAQALASNRRALFGLVSSVGVCHLNTEPLNFGIFKGDNGLLPTLLNLLKP